ncbi:MAG: YegP family protein [Pyrinomonadaceae bacterium]
MSGKFEIKNSTNGKFLFNLKAGNGQIILSSQLYETKAATTNGIESVKTNASNDAHYERLTSKGDHPYFVLKAGNGQEIGKSEMYNSTAAMENGIESVKTNAPTAEIIDTTNA